MASNRFASALSITIFLLVGTAYAADYNRLAGDGAWDNPSLWSPNGVPGASDNAHIESGAGNITLAGNVTVGLLDLAGTYTNSISVGSYSITAGQVSMAGGTFNGQSGSLTCTGSFAIAGGVFNAPATLTLKGNVSISAGTFNHGGNQTNFWTNYLSPQAIGTGTAIFNHVSIKGNGATTTTISGDLLVAGDLTFGMAQFSGNKLNGGRILAQKNVKMDSPDFGTNGSSPGSVTIVLCGTADQTIDGAQSGRFPSVQVNKPSGLVHFAGTPRVYGNWEWLSADGLDVGSSELILATPYNTVVSIKGGAVAYGNVTYKGWGQASKQDLVGDFNVGGNLTLDMVAYSGNQVTGANFVVAGDVIMNNAGFGSASWGPGNSTIKLAGAGNHAIISNSDGHFPNILIDTTGTVTTVGNVIVSGDWTLANGAFTQGTGTLTFQAPYSSARTITPGNGSYGNVNIQGHGTSVQTVAGTLNCQDLLLKSIEYNGAKLNGGAVEVRGNFTLPGDGFGASDAGPGTATIRMVGSGTISAGGLARCPSLEINSSGTITFAGSIRLGSNYIHTSGNVVTAGSTQTLVGRQDSLVTGAAQFGNLIVQKGPYGAPYKVTIDGQAAASGGFTLTEGTFVFKESASLSVAGDVSVAASNVSLTAGNNSTLGLSGSAAQSVNLAGASVFNLSVSNSAAPVTFTSAYTATGATSASPGASLLFASGVTFNTGNLSMNGFAGQGVTLGASTVGTAANLVAAPYQFVRYAEIKDINASGGRKIVAIHSTDCGNNQNIVFQDAALLAISTLVTSKTSPAWVEGVSGPDCTSVNVSVSNDSFAAHRLNPTQWYGHNASVSGSSLGVALTPDSASELSVTVANAFGENNTATQSLSWTPTDMAGKNYSTDILKIRKGDSLLLTATGTGDVLEIDGDGDGTYEHSGIPGQKFPHMYVASGSFVARAKIDGVEVGSLTVVVVSTDLHGPIACQKSYERDLQVFAYPTTEAPGISYSAEDPYLLKVTTTQVTSTGANLKLKPSSMNNPPLISRMGTDGPIISVQPTTVFIVNDLSKHILGFAIDDANYGHGYVRYQIVPRTVIDNDNPVTTAQEGLYFDLGCLGAGMVFAENGQSTLRVHSNRQDQDGIFEAEVLLAPGQAFVCHSIQPRQINSDNLVGDYTYHNPCVMLARGGLYLDREMSDETIRDGKNNLYPDGHPEANKQIFQVWDQDSAIDGRWTSEIEVAAFTPEAMEAAFFAPKARKPVMPNRHFTVEVVQPGNSFQFAVRMAPGSTGIKGGTDIEDNSGVNRDEVLYEREPSLPDNYLKWMSGYPSVYPALNLPPNHWGRDYQDPSKNYRSWDFPFPRYATYPWYTDIGFYKGNMIGKMSVWGTCEPAVGQVKRKHVTPNVRPGAPGNPQTNTDFESDDTIWGGEESEFRDILRFGRLEADGYAETDIPDNGNGQGSTTADISSRNVFPEVVGANAVEIQNVVQIPDPNNPGQTIPKTETYLRTQHEGSVGSANPVPVQITFRAPPGETVRVGVAIARRAEKDDPQTPENEIDNDGKKTHRAWLHLSNTAIFESRGQPEDGEDVKAEKVVEILAFDQDGNIANEKPAERVVRFSMTASSNWLATQTVYIYGIEPSTSLDDLKLVVWGEEIMEWKAYPKEVQAHHYESQQLDPNVPIKRWYITDEEPINIADLDLKDSKENINKLGGHPDIYPEIEVLYPSEGAVFKDGAPVTVIGRIKTNVFASNSDAILRVNETQIQTSNGYFITTTLPYIENENHIIKLSVENAWGRKSEHKIGVILDDSIDSSEIKHAISITSSVGAYFVDRNLRNETARNDTLVLGNVLNGSEQRSILRFSSVSNLVGTQIPASAQITKALLILKVNQGNATTERTIEIARIVDPLALGNWEVPNSVTDVHGSNAEFATNTGTNWNEKSHGIQWTTQGGDFSSNDKVEVTRPIRSGDQLVVDVTTHINRWLAGDPEQGWILRTNGEEIAFHSPDAPEPEVRPILIIEYKEAVQP